MTPGRWRRWRTALAVLGMVAIGLALLWPRAPEPPASVTSVAQLEAYIETLVEFGTPPGMSLVVVKIREHILEPLGMKHTDFLYTKAMEPFEAAGAHPVFNMWTPLIPFLAPLYVREISGNHVWLKRVYNDQTPPSGLIGPATDAARLVSAYLNGGELDGRRILSRESIAAMTHEEHIRGKTGEPQVNRQQGIGWQVYDDKGRFMIKHDGGGLGFSTVIQIYPDDKLGFVLFTNDVTCEGWRIVNLAASLDW